MTKLNFHLIILDPDDIEFLKTKPNLTFFLREIINDFRTGKLNYSEKNVDAETKIVKLRKLKAEATIKELELKYMQNFGNYPSSRGKTAIKTRIYSDSSIVNENNSEKNYREMTPEETNEFAKLISLQIREEGYEITCLLCRMVISYEERLEAVFEANRHLVSIHGKKFLK